LVTQREDLELEGGARSKATAERREGRAPLVVAIEAAGFRNLHDMPVFGLLHRPRCRAVHGKRAVATPAVVMLEVVAEEPPQVTFVEDDDLAQALAANAPDRPLDERVLPGTPRGLGERAKPAKGERVITGQEG
jgi:hypothetical protein